MHDQGSIHRYMRDDHRRLEALLEKRAKEGEAASTDYQEFRSGLLRHIAIEERLLIPALLQTGSGDKDLFARLRRQHGAISALLMPDPTPLVIETLRTVLSKHNPLEEDAHGLYDFLDQLPSEEVAELLEKAKQYPTPKVAKHVNSDTVWLAIAENLKSIGMAKLADHFRPLDA